jgi:hypothetical protein
MPLMQCLYIYVPMDDKYASQHCMAFHQGLGNFIAGSLPFLAVFIRLPAFWPARKLTSQQTAYSSVVPMSEFYIIVLGADNN